MQWIPVGNDYYNLDMLIQIHDPGADDGAGVTVRIIGTAGLLPVPSAAALVLRAMVGYNLSLPAGRPAPPPAAQSDTSTMRGNSPN